MTQHLTKPLLGCIADDFTGATDLANNLVRAGMRVVQTIGVPTGPLNAEVNAELVELSLGVLKIESRVHLTQGRAVELVAVDYERRDGMPVVGRVDNRMLEPHEHRNRSILFVTGLELNTKRHFESWQRSATSE